MGIPNIIEEIEKPKNNKIIKLQLVNGSLSINNNKKNNKLESKKIKKSTEVYAFKSKEEIDKMIKIFDKHIDEADTPDHEHIARRNKMLFIIGINISIRGSDISALKWSDFFYDNYTMKTGTKIQPIKTRRTGKYVTLMFNKAVKNIINEYIALYPIQNLDDFIFSSRKGGSISRMSIGRIIKNTAIEAGIKQNINSHSLRKTFGYHVWHDAKDKQEALVLLQFIFGHNSITDTMKYIGLIDSDIEKIFNSISLGM